MVDKDKKLIKEQILSVLSETELKVKDIILFGSRARGESTKYSDWDFLIIVKEDITLKEKRKKKNSESN